MTEAAEAFRSPGAVTTGFVASAGGGLGVVGVEADVAPALGASCTPGALEPPQAARATTAATAPTISAMRLGIERGRVATCAAL